MATEALLTRWQDLAHEKPRAFPSEIAQELGVSEGELLATKIGGGSTRLRREWIEILSELGRLGEVKSITRNEFAVLEKNGTYPPFQHFDGHAMFVSEEIDMRIALSEWQFALAVRNPGRADGSESRSVQFYGKDGTAMHKVFLLPQSNEDAYNELVLRFADEDQSAGEPFSAKAVKDEMPDSAIDREGLMKGWSALEDTHGFFGLLARFRVSRPQAMRLASGNFTHRVDGESLNELLQHVSRGQVPVMLFIGNEGCLQIQKGIVTNVVRAHGWLNVMDPGVEVHLKEDHIAESWLVEKPTMDGSIRSLELFDAAGRDVLSIFGVRTEGKRQSAEWHSSLDGLAVLHSGVGV